MIEQLGLLFAEPGLLSNHPLLVATIIELVDGHFLGSWEFTA